MNPPPKKAPRPTYDYISQQDKILRVYWQTSDGLEIEERGRDLLQLKNQMET